MAARPPSLSTSGKTAAQQKEDRLKGLFQRAVLKLNADPDDDPESVVRQLLDHLPSAGERVPNHAENALPLVSSLCLTQQPSALRSQQHLLSVCQGKCVRGGEEPSSPMLCPM